MRSKTKVRYIHIKGHRAQGMENLKSAIADLKSQITNTSPLSRSPLFEMVPL